MRFSIYRSKHRQKRLKFIPKVHSWRPVACYNPERKAKTIWWLWLLISVFYGGNRTEEENRAIWKWPYKAWWKQ